MPAITPQDIEWVATLARLTLSEKEKKQYAEELSVIFDYIEQLNGVETDDVPETCQVTGLEDVVREDKVLACEEKTKQKLIAAFPEKVGKVLKVKAVFDQA